MDQFEIAEIYDSGDTVLFEFHFKGFRKASASTGGFTNILLEKYVCKDGKILRVEVFFWDTHKVLSLLS